MKRTSIDQMVRCPVCGAMAYPLVNKEQLESLKEGEEVILMCGACKRIMNPFFHLMKEYADRFEQLKNKSNPTDEPLIDPKEIIVESPKEESAPQ